MGNVTSTDSVDTKPSQNKNIKNMEEYIQDLNSQLLTFFTFKMYSNYIYGCLNMKRLRVKDIFDGKKQYLDLEFLETIPPKIDVKDIIFPEFNYRYQNYANNYEMKYIIIKGFLSHLDHDLIIRTLFKLDKPIILKKEESKVINHHKPSECLEKMFEFSHKIQCKDIKYSRILRSFNTQNREWSYKMHIPFETVSLTYDKKEVYFNVSYTEDFKYSRDEIDFHTLYDVYYVYLSDIMYLKYKKDRVLELVIEDFDLHCENFTSRVIYYFNKLFNFS